MERPDWAAPEAEVESMRSDLVKLGNHPDVRHAFERRLTEYIDAIHADVNLLLKRNHEIAFIGAKGIGKSTAICKATGLEVASLDGGAPLPVLEAGGGVTVCDVHLSAGQGYGIIVEPAADDDIRAYVMDFADHIKGADAGKSQEFDAVLMVLLDENLDAFEIVEADRGPVIAALAAPGSRARNERGALA